MNRPRIVLSHRVFDETAQQLRSFADVIGPIDSDALTPVRLKRELAVADAWMAFMPDSADDRLLARCPNLRLIAGALKGYDNFDIDACTRRGVWVSVVPDLLTVPTAELIIGLMIGVGRHLIAGDHWIRSGKFRGWRPNLYGMGLSGARVGFIGMGVIGQAVAQRLVPFGVEQRYFDPRSLSHSMQQQLHVERAADFSSLLEWSDYLVLAAPLTAQTLHVINAQALAQVRPGCLLINASRGSLVDEAAILAALEQGRLGGYAADVFEMEDWARADRPRTISAQLRKHPATLFTPHVGSAVTQVRRAIEKHTADNILDAFSGRIPRDAVNPGARAV